MGNRFNSLPSSSDSWEKASEFVSLLPYLYCAVICPVVNVTQSAKVPLTPDQDSFHCQSALRVFRAPEVPTVNFEPSPSASGNSHITTRYLCLPT